MKKLSFIIAAALMAMPALAAQSDLFKGGTPLAGTAIGSGSNPGAAFDCDVSTVYQHENANYPYVGLDLGSKHIINHVAFVAADGADMELGIFEGANDPSFIDAVPIQMIKTRPESGKTVYLPGQVSRAFRYVRYVSPKRKNLARNCRVAEVAFFGAAGEGNDNHLYQRDASTNEPSYFVQGAQFSAETKMESGYQSRYYDWTPGSNDLSGLKKDGLYVGGSDYTLHKVLALTNTNVPTGVEGVDGDDNAPNQWYNLQGLRVAEPLPGGVYIRVRGDKSEKVAF